MDVSLAIDLVEAIHQQSYDVAIVVSQDADLNPAVAMGKRVAQTKIGQSISSQPSHWFPVSVYSGSPAPLGSPSTRRPMISASI